MSNMRIIKDINLPTGGTYDIFIMDLIQGYPNGKIVFSLVTTPSGTSTEGVSRKVTGIQKVAQQFLMCLLKRKGSDALHPDDGTYFVDSYAGSNLTSKAEVEARIRQAISEASDQVSAKTAFRQDTSEQLTSAELTRIDVGVNSISVGIKIVTAAGEYASLYTPFPRFDMTFNDGDS